MKWTETREIAASRARLKNSIKFSPIQLILSAVLFGLIPAVGTSILAVIENKSISGHSMLILVPISSSVGILLYLTFLLKGRYSVNKCRCSIIFDYQKVTAMGNGITKTAAYSDLLGYSIFDLSKTTPDGKLIVFGDPAGRNLAVGIPPQISIDDVRIFLSGKLRELPNEEIPDPRRGSQEKTTGALS